MIDRTEHTLMGLCSVLEILESLDANYHYVGQVAEGAADVIITVTFRLQWQEFAISRDLVDIPDNWPRVAEIVFRGMNQATNRGPDRADGRAYLWDDTGKGTIMLHLSESEKFTDPPRTACGLEMMRGRAVMRLDIIPTPRPPQCPLCFHALDG